MLKIGSIFTHVAIFMVPLLLFTINVHLPGPSYLVTMDIFDTWKFYMILPMLYENNQIQLWSFNNI